MKKKKIMAVMLTLSLAAGVLAGCGGGNESTPAQNGEADTISGQKTEEAPEETDSAEVAQESGEVVEINYFTYRSQPDRHPEKLIEEFEKQNPNIKVNYQIVKNLDEYLKTQQVRMLSGTDIDVTTVRPESLADYIEAGYLMDITGDEYLGNYKEGMLDKITIDGKVYGIADAINLIGVYYNKDMFQENGIKVPETYEEFMTACDAFKEKGYYCMANGCKDGWPVHFDIYTYMHDLIVADPEVFEKVNNGEISYTDPIFVDAFKKIDDFYNAGYLSPDSMSFTGDDAVALFVSEKIPMLCQGEWQATVFDDAQLEFELGVFPIPVESTDEVVVPVSVGSYNAGVSSTKHPEEVRKFLAFMSSTEGASITANQMKQFSPVEGVELEGDSAMNLFNALLNEKTVDFFYSSQNAEDNSEFDKLLQEMFLDVITPEELAQRLEDYRER